MDHNYEFTAEQEKIFADLAKHVRLVGISILTIIALKIIGFCFYLSAEHTLLIVDLLVIFIIALCHFSASKSLQKVVDTEGNDIQHFTNAIKNFNRFYFLYYWAFVIFILSTAFSYLFNLGVEG